jgi:hypothetical protein
MRQIGVVTQVFLNYAFAQSMIGGVYIPFKNFPADEIGLRQFLLIDDEIEFEEGPIAGPAAGKSGKKRLPVALNVTLVTPRLRGAETPG